MTDVVLGIDLGTSGVKVTLLDRTGQAHATATATYPTLHPKPGWLEQDPEEWWRATVDATRSCVEQVSHTRVAGIGLSGHMSGLVLAKNDGTVVRPCMLLADARGGTEVDALPAALLEALRLRTGNVPSEVFTIGKLLWVREHGAGSYQAADLVLFPKDFVRFRLTGRAGTEPTDAGNSLLLNGELTDWDTELLAHVALDAGMFPDMLEPAEVAGSLTNGAAQRLGLAPGLPVVAGGSDMACSALGCGAVTQDVVAVTIGTAAQVVRPVPAVQPSRSGTVTFHPHVLAGKLYAMGSILSGGLALSWASKAVAPGVALDALLRAAGSIAPGSGGVLFVPTLVGSGTPWWEPTARAAWIGLGPSAGRGTLVRSVLEGVAFNIRESVEALDDLGGTARELRFGGGGSRSHLWAQITAAVLGRSVRLLANPDASAVGAAALAAVGVGWFDTPQSAASAMVRVLDRIPADATSSATYQRLYPLYKAAFQALRAVDTGLSDLGL